MADLETRVLIVDDEKRDIELVETALSSIRLRILKLTDPREVLQKVESERPDVVILDALLPGMSGFDLCKEIKSAPDSKQTGVLILTGVYLRDNYRREAVHQFKADGFLTKPFRPRELQRTFLKILAGKLRMTPRKVQEELAAGQDILLPSELEEKSGWLGRIFGRLRSSPDPSVTAGFLHAAEMSEDAPVEPVTPVDPADPEEETVEQRKLREADEAGEEPEAKLEERAETEQEEKLVVEEASVLVETLERDAEGTEGIGPHYTVEGEEQVPEEIPLEMETEGKSAGAQEVIEFVESVFEQPVEEVHAADPEAAVDVEPVISEPEPEPEPEPLPEATPAFDPEPAVEGEVGSEPKAAPEPEPTSEPESAPEPLPEKPLEKPPESPPEDIQSPGPELADLDSARSLFEAMEGAGLETEVEAADWASADPTMTMPIDPSIIEELRKPEVTVTPLSAIEPEEGPETSVEEDQAPGEMPQTSESESTDKPAAELVNEAAEAAEVAEAGMAEESTIEAESEPTAEEPVIEMVAEPQPVIEASRKQAVDNEAGAEAAPAAAVEAAVHVPEPTPAPVAEPMANPSSEPAVETTEEPILDFPQELAFYREREFMRELKRELSKCRRVERPLTLILVRVTDLEQIAEIFGKAYRPKVLTHVAEQALGALRDVDSVGLLESKELLALTAFASDRYGGERILSRLRKALRDHPFDVGLGIADFVPKLLFGLASFPKDAETVIDLLAHAEQEIVAE